MESFEAYLARKRQELELLNGFLGSPLPLRPPGSAREVIEQKFHIAAALKAEHTLQDWALTETAWAHPGQVRVGPFEFSYDYQRADLDVRGPSFYELGEFGDGEREHLHGFRNGGDSRAAPRLRPRFLRSGHRGVAQLLR